MSNRKGFTLIELLIVVVIIGILAAIALPKFSATKEKAYLAAMKADLRNFATEQEVNFETNGAYLSGAASNVGGAVTKVGAFAPSAGVTLTITGVAAPAAGWSAVATHVQTAKKCAIFYNTAAVAPAVSEGEPKCEA